jgi:hypothetical protein
VTIIFGNVEGTWRYMRHCDGGMRVLEMTGGLNKDEKLRGKSKKPTPHVRVRRTNENFSSLRRAEFLKNERMQVR